MKKTYTKAAEPKKSTAEIVTARILEIIESTGQLPWLKPWIPVAGSGSSPRNFISGKVYQGVNALLLSSIQHAAGYASPYWLTFKQTQEKGGMVRRGEKGTPVVYYNFIEIEDQETGDEKKIPFLKYSTVFNLAQVDGIEAPAVEATIEAPAFNPIEAAEAILAGASLPQINHGGKKAYYSPALDYIQMPKKGQFRSEAEYYNTLFHEAAHSTGHTSRLGRKGVTEATYFGSHEYSKEELVAEITAASLSHEAGFFEEIDRNSAAYVKSWVKALKDDKNMIIQAAGAAQKAFDFILNRKASEMKEAA